MSSVATEHLEFELLPSHKPFQGAVSSEHPLVVVSTTQAEDCDESSSFLMEWLLQAAPSLASMDLMSTEGRDPAVLSAQPQGIPAALLLS